MNCRECWGEGTIRLPDPFADRPCKECGGEGSVTEKERAKQDAAAKRRLDRAAKAMFADQRY